MKGIKEPPCAIMINVPEAFFQHKGKIEGEKEREAVFRKHYENMGKPGFEEECFYHFISNVPVHDVQHVYVCFKGEIQYKAILVRFIKNEPVVLPGYVHERPRDWCVTTGPVIKAPPGEYPQKGFRGFKYVFEELF